MDSETDEGGKDTGIEYNATRCSGPEVLPVFGRANNSETVLEEVVL
jgi:hypothetical protein